jgi:hypothetical protein
VGVQVGGLSKAYDWNRLKERRVINDQVGDTPIFLILSSDQQSFAAFERPAASELFTIQGRYTQLGGEVLGETKTCLPVRPPPSAPTNPNND